MPSPVFAEHLARYGPNRNLPGKFTWAEAQAYCKNLAKQHYENFVVASLLLPWRLRPDFYSIYAWCRWADDLADEMASPEESLELLDWWEDELRALYAGQPAHIVNVALRETIIRYVIPIDPFLNLIKAFRQDQIQTRYETMAQLLEYCQYSANPVGRLVLCLGYLDEPAECELSDSICTGLQLANFWQDIAQDWQRGRLYVPRDVQQKHDVGEEDFAQGIATPKLKQLVASQVEQAEHFLRAGLPLIHRVPLDMRVDIELFARGGMSILSAIRKADFDVWTARPKVSKATQIQLLAGCWWRGQVARWRRETA